VPASGSGVCSSSSLQEAKNKRASIGMMYIFFIADKAKRFIDYSDDYKVLQKKPYKHVR
jgi:hypothetical protein